MRMNSHTHLNFLFRPGQALKATYLVYESYYFELHSIQNELIHQV